MEQNYFVSSSILGLLKEYEDALANEGKSLLTTYFPYHPNHTAVKNFLRYVFEVLLQWTPEDVQKNLTKDMADRMKLWRVINSLDFPEELNKKEDLWYIAHLLYPEQIAYDRVAYTMSVYENVLSNKNPRIPKWFFSTFNGEINASLCLNMALNRYMTSTTVPELYHFFADTKAAMAFLQDVRLTQACNNFFSSPLEMLHSSLAPEDRDEYWYSYYSVMSSVRDTGLPAVPWVFMTDQEEYEMVKKEFAESFNEAAKFIMERDASSNA